MSKKEENIRKGKDVKDEALSPLEMLLSGKAGPLPMDNDLAVQPESAGATKEKTPSSGSVESLGPYMSGVAARVKKAYPNLTDEELTSKLAEM